LVTTVVGFSGQVTAWTFALLIAASALSVPAGVMLEIQVRRVLLARGLWGLTALLIGGGEAIERISAFLLKHPEIGLRPVGFLGEADSAMGSVSHLGSISDAARFATNADTAVITHSAARQAIELTQLPFRRVLIVSDMGPFPAQWLRSRALGEIPAIEFENRTLAASASVAKRTLDLVIGLPLLLITLPTILFFALLVRLVSPGPAFYVQRRIGWNGRQISVFKIRTMYQDAEQRLAELLATNAEARAEWGRHVKLRHDPRVLPVIGTFLRRTSMDELPQLWNVVRGDISLVGPRPFPSYHLDCFPADFCLLRQAVRPGLTGLWQVSDRSDADLILQQALDTFYIKNWSLWLDLYIILKTLPAVLNARGAR
jgi:Undecaprenyl-phosphate galactose phosphotransferase WbaP